MKPIQRSQTIFIPIGAGATLGSKIFLPDIPELRDALVEGIETYSDAELATDLQGNSVVDVTGIADCVLNLVQESDRRAQDFPLNSLLAVQYGGIYKEFTGWQLNWQKCYLQLTGGNPAGKTVVLNVFYRYGSKR
jgi:hypothetical protein